MRARAAIVGVIAGFAAGQACAGDLQAVPGAGVAYYGGYGGVRAPMLYIYDDQPGVYIRPYWIPPWQNRHYFPHTGRKPKLGRRENAVARYFPKQAQPFYRSWSISSAFAADWPRGPVLNANPIPLEPSLK